MVGQQQRDDRGHRRDEQRHLHRGRDRDLGREVGVATLRDHDRSAMLRRVPDDRDDHDRDEELVQSDRLAERLQRMDENLRDERRRERRHGERQRATP